MMPVNTLMLIFGILTALGFVWVSGLKREMLFTKNTILDDTVCPDDERVVSSSARSAVACSAKCSRVAACRSFFYNHVTSECAGCDRAYYTYQPSTRTTSPGMAYYEPVHVSLTCQELQVVGADSGVYHLLTPLTWTPVSVYCDMDTQGGGWMVWQNRFDGSVDFEFRTFADHEVGFGHPSREYWLGLQFLYEFLAAHPSDVYLQFTDFSDVSVYEWFHNMSLSAPPLYTLNIGLFNSANDTSYDYGFRRNGGYPFSTKDNIKGGGAHCPSDYTGGWWYYTLCQGYDYGFRRNGGYPFSTKDNIQGGGAHCPSDYTGGWWYYTCVRVNVNGRYGAPGTSGYPYMYNIEWKPDYESLKATRLMVR